jgi:hypothetical protein
VTECEPPPVFDRYEQRVRERLLNLRRLILDVAETERVGPLEEVLKWGEPSFVTHQPRTGSTIRINAVGPSHYGLFVNCKTSLADTFRSLYPDDLTVIGDRELRFGIDDELPEGPVRRCIALALTYHRWKPR